MVLLRGGEVGRPHGQFPAEWVFDVWTRRVVGTKVLRVAFPPEVTRPYVRAGLKFDAGQNLRISVDSPRVGWPFVSNNPVELLVLQGG